jgi:hypothetical protein
MVWGEGSTRPLTKISRWPFLSQRKLALTAINKLYTIIGAPKKMQKPAASRSKAKFCEILSKLFKSISWASPFNAKSTSILPTRSDNLIELHSSVNKNALLHKKQSNLLNTRIERSWMGFALNARYKFKQYLKEEHLKYYKPCRGPC